MKLPILSLSAALLASSAALAAECQAPTNPSKFSSWLSGVKKEASGMGISRNAVSVLDGMTYDPADDFDHPSVPDSSPLRRHVLYRLPAHRAVRPAHCRI